MTKALFLGLPLHGHTNPSLPLVRELVGRGEEVVYYSADPFAARIEHSGARYRPYRNAFLADITRLPERMDELSWLLMETTADILDRELDAFRAERPDYVIADSVAPWGQWVGEVLGVPVVTSVSTFAFNRHVLAFAASHGVRPKSAKLLLSKIRYIYKALRLGRRLSRKYGVRGPGDHRPCARPLRLEHRLHLAVLPALRRDLRRSLPVRRPLSHARRYVRCEG
jgi:Glycosyl transferases, related to UDP-glucuronosyltransferase